MYDPRLVVGAFFEERVREIFDLKVADIGNTGVFPDLISKNGSFVVEVKAASYRNGGDIKRKQLYRFGDDESRRRFYAFPYHSIWKNMRRDFPTSSSLKVALDLRSLYLFPFSIVEAYFETSHITVTPHHDDFARLRESHARKIFILDKKAWQQLGLDIVEYKMSQPHEKVHIVTRKGLLESELLASFHPEFIRF